MYFYDNQSQGFYLNGIHTQIPKTAVEISEDLYIELLNGQSEGKLIQVNGTGIPYLAEPAPIDIESLRTQLIDDIDNRAADIVTHWSRFAEEYKEREAAALAFQQANFEGEPSIYITSFSSVAGLDNRAATLLILQQAEGLRKLQEALAVQRMRKYELKQPNLTEQQLREIHDDIIAQMNKLMEAYHG